MSKFGFKRYHSPSFPPEDNMGFATPAAPGHSMSLLNNYMRTDILRSLHQRIQRRIDDAIEGSPLNHIADSLAEVIEICEVNLFECVERNPFHIDPGYEFDREKDFLHDVELMKYHLNAHKKTLRELSEDW
jgi:hypothetical protein